MAKPLDLPFDPIERAGEIWADTWGPASAMRVATSVMRVQQILLARYDEVLVLLHFSRTGALPLKVIGSRLMVHPTSVTNAITRLVAAGLVERLANPRDRRGALASITARGREVAEAGTRDLMAIDFGLGALDERTRESAFATLRKVRSEAGDFQEKPPTETVDQGASHDWASPAP